MQKPNAAEEDWKLLTTFFPARWTELAEETAALKGLRQDKSPEKIFARVVAASWLWPLAARDGDASPAS